MGIPLIGELIPKNNGKFALIDSSNVRGGLMQVETIDDRDSIADDLLKVGSIVYVQEVNKFYQRSSNRWKEIKLSNDKIIAPTLTIENISDDSITLSNHNLIIGDILGFNMDGISGDFAEVTLIEGNIISLSRSITAIIGDTCYIVGSRTDRNKQLVTITNNDSITSYLNTDIDNLFKNIQTRIGRTSSTYDFYADNAYIRGRHIDFLGNDLATQIAQHNASIERIQTSLYRQNLIKNPDFIEGTLYWKYVSPIKKLFSIGKNGNIRFIKSQGKFLGNCDPDQVYTYMDGNRQVVRVKNSTITQLHKYLKLNTIEDEVQFPCYVTLIFDYRPIQDNSRITIKIGEQTKVLNNLQSTYEYSIANHGIIWDGTGDITIQVEGEVNISSVSLHFDALKNFEQKYKWLLDNEDKLKQLLSTI